GRQLRRARWRVLQGVQHPGETAEVVDRFRCGGRGYAHAARLPVRRYDHDRGQVRHGRADAAQRGPGQTGLQRPHQRAMGDEQRGCAGRGIHGPNLLPTHRPINPPSGHGPFRGRCLLPGVTLDPRVPRRGSRPSPAAIHTKNPALPPRVRSLLPTAAAPGWVIAAMLLYIAATSAWVFSPCFPVQWLQALDSASGGWLASTLVLAVGFG